MQAKQYQNKSKIGGFIYDYCQPDWINSALSHFCAFTILFGKLLDNFAFAAARTQYTHTPKFRHNFAVVYENCMAAYSLYQPLYTKTIIIFASIGSLRVPSFFPVASASSAATGLFHSLWQ